MQNNFLSFCYISFFLLLLKPFLLSYSSQMEGMTRGCVECVYHRRKGILTHVVHLGALVIPRDAPPLPTHFRNETSWKSRPSPRTILSAANLLHHSLCSRLGAPNRCTVLPAAQKKGGKGIFGPTLFSFMRSLSRASSSHPHERERPPLRMHQHTTSTAAAAAKTRHAVSPSTRRRQRA
ncbi:hypothetical protein C8R45DRAFT_1000642 [Mycena sanguinolenta]|nr:hypothetical protein C8R45DRAFT_1000642 [Mycena sanguinolenta]